MPIKRYDSNSGGIVFDLTPEEEEMQTEQTRNKGICPQSDR